MTLGNEARTAEDLITALRGRGWRLALAESCTGGLASDMITNVPGSSAVFAGAVVAYANDAKTSVLGVPRALLARHGAVSGPVARAMANGARRVLNAEAAGAVTGIAGPSAVGTDKPVGLTYLAAATPAGVRVRELHHSGDRLENKHASAVALLRLVLESVRAYRP